jgi:MFS family permease
VATTPAVPAHPATGPGPHSGQSGQNAVHRGATRKAMARLLPVLCLAYFMSYVDRTNIALAKTHLEADVGISVAAFGLGAGLFFITYACLEIPSNLVMYRVGPRRWIARIAISWGLVTALMVFVNGDISFYVLRMALGAAEAGLYPAMMFMITQWFHQRDRGVAVGYIYVAGAAGMFLGSPLSGALLELQDVGGLHGWQWMFLIEGVVTVVVGVLVLVLLPNRAHDARWLTTAEADALQHAATGEDAAHERHSLRGNLATAFGRPFIVLIGVIYFLNQVSANGVGLNVPSIIEDMDIDSSFVIGVLSGITGLGGLIGVLVIPRLARRMSNEITLLGALAAACAVASLLFLATGSPVMRIVLIGVLGFLMIGTLPTIWSVAMPRMTGLMAAAGLAFINTVGMFGGFVGPFAFGQIETHSGTPVTGFWLVCAVSVIGAALTVPLVGAIRRADRDLAAETGATRNDKENHHE